MTDSFEDHMEALWNTEKLKEFCLTLGITNILIIKASKNTSSIIISGYKTNHPCKGMLLNKYVAQSMNFDYDNTFDTNIATSYKPLITGKHSYNKDTKEWCLDI